MACSSLQAVFGQATEIRQISTPFDGIWVQSHLSVNLTIGDTENIVRIKGFVADIKNIKTIVEDGHLIIRPIDQNVVLNGILQIQVSVKPLVELIASGSSVVTFQSKVPVNKFVIILCDSACLKGNFTGDKLGISVSGSGSVFATVVVAKLIVEVNNAGDVTVAGIADAVAVSIDGSAGTFHGQNLEARDLVTVLNSSGQANVRGITGSVESGVNGWATTNYNTSIQRFNAIKAVIKMGFTVEKVFKAVNEWSKENPTQDPTKEALIPLLLDLPKSATVVSTYPPDLIEDSRQCVICMDQLANVTFLPCRHVKTCTNCARSVDKCPVCRRVIANRMQVYL